MFTNRPTSAKLRRLVVALFCVALSPLLTACFRDASEVVVEQQPVAQEVTAPTLASTATPLPAETEAPSEVIATEAPPDHFALTATALLAQLTQSADQGSAADAETDAEAAAPTTAAIVPTAVPLVRVTVPPGEDCVHEIRAGETLYMLSLAYGSSVNRIAEASGINDVDRITVGQRITIPGCGSAGFAPPPTTQPTATVDVEALPAPPAESAEAVIVEADSGDAINALVQRAQDTILSNAQAQLAAGVSAQSVAATPSRSYTVQQDDTLLGIALRFGTSLDALASLNSITDINEVAEGDVLWIP